MPRKARLDAYGMIHHIVFRGIERRRIFRDDGDRDRFLARLKSLLTHTGTACYAWALIPNHVHLLLRTGETPIAQVMRCLLTGYAVGFNRRHRRHGHLFQNRYKSILCQEDSYLLELVRYIHLNPLRSRLVSSLSDLDAFPYCGHSAVLGDHPREWQDTETVLRQFGPDTFKARREYRKYVAKGLDLRRRPELTGGGLVRSIGGWAEVKRQRKAGVWVSGDERILGDSEFVRKVLETGQERLERKYAYRSQGWDFDRLVVRVTEVLTIDKSRMLQKGRYPDAVAARSLLCYWGHLELGISTVELARRLGLTQPAISVSIARGRAIALRKRLVMVNPKA